MSSVKTETQTKARVFKIPAKFSKNESTPTKLPEEQKEPLADKVEINNNKEVNNNEDSTEKKEKYKRKIVWFNAIGFLILHTAALYGSFLIVARAKFLTSVWSKSLSCFRPIEFPLLKISLLGSKIIMSGSNSAQGSHYQ